LIAHASRSLEQFDGDPEMNDNLIVVTISQVASFDVPAIVSVAL